MSAKIDPEEMLISDIASFHDDPCGFVIYAFPWTEGEGPDQWQRDFLLSIGEQIKNGKSAAEAIRFATAAGHGVGKSALVAWLILWAMSTRPHLAGVVTANTARQLADKTWRELSIWHKRAINAHWFRMAATKFYQSNHPDTWFVSAVPWTKERPEAFAGLHAKDVLVIYDEASAIDDVIWDTTEGAMTTPGAMWFAFGNPTRNTGRFRECFGKFRHRWTTAKIDARTAKMANNIQINQWIEDYGVDSDFVRMRVTGDFPKGSVTNLIPLDRVEAAIACKLPALYKNPAPVIFGVDPAWMGGDRSVIVMRQGIYARELWQGREIDTLKLSSIVAQYAQEHRPDAVFVDQTGIGAGVVDQLRSLGCNPTGIPFSGAAIDAVRFINKRAEMWWELKEWLASDVCLQPGEKSQSDWISDLVGPEYLYTPTGKIQLESKADMRSRGLASPDLADALALTFAAPVARIGESHGVFANSFAKEFKVFGRHS